MITVFLNNMNYRYDVFQIVNLFYTFEEIEFVDQKGDIDINITDVGIVVTGSEHNCSLSFNSSNSSKETVKLAVYSFLSNVTNKELPWGTLVGIRPSKIALNFLDKQLSEEEIIKYYSEHYKARPDKARLCIDVAKLERRFVNNNTNNISVYIGMPFCPTRCVYCSFASNPIGSSKSLVEPYLNALKHEIISIAEFIKKKKLNIQCVYFGGGTPTAVDDEQFEDVMSCINNNLIKDMCVQEFTVECGRPDSISEMKLLAMKNSGVHRISINPQTMNDETLRKIGRNHNSQQVVEKFKLARKLGFDNINMDIIIGLEGEDLNAVNNTCGRVRQLMPDSITVHGLSIKRASKLHENLAGEKTSISDQNAANMMFEETSKLAESLNMKPYYMYRQKNTFGNMENVGYSIEGKEGIYNIQMIEEKQTIIAAGADAVTKVVFLDENRIERHANVKDVSEYIKRIDEMIEKKLMLLESLYL